MMKNILITGSGGLIGSEAVEYYCRKGCIVKGIDNNYREILFGKDGSVINRINYLEKTFDNFENENCDIQATSLPFTSESFDLIIHTAAQPSHDWAVKDPKTDFNINAYGTLNLLEAYRTHWADATFIFTSTNKVYGDQPNHFEYIECDNRWTPVNTNISINGFNEQLSIDQCLHSLFGASKVSADILVQEYGKYFKLNTGVFRGGCLTGPNHSGVELHGFLSYLVKCLIHNKPYKVFGWKGKQVRDNIHSSDLISAFDEFGKNPRPGEVYNIGGGTFSNCSMIEAINIAEKYTNKKLNYSYVDDNRIGDHKWWISDTSKFKSHYPSWNQKYSIHDIIHEICDFETNKLF